MEKHSAGPWTYEQRDGERHIHAANGESLQCDARYYPWVSANEADWHLIAAAPDLLAACKEFVRKCDCGEARSERSYAQMVAAIAKAEGTPL